MAEKVIIADSGDRHHLPLRPHFRSGTETLCNVIDENEAQAVPLTAAKKKGYSQTCNHCQSRRSQLERTERKDTLPTPEEAVEKIRDLREGES